MQSPRAPVWPRPSVLYILTLFFCSCLVASRNPHGQKRSRCRPPKDSREKRERESQDCGPPLRMLRDGKDGEKETRNSLFINRPLAHPTDVRDIWRVKAPWMLGLERGCDTSGMDTYYCPHARLLSLLVDRHVLFLARTIKKEQKKKK